MNIRSSEQAKRTDIPAKVKMAVWNRDRGRCVVCSDPNAMPNAHFISRAHGGQGIEQNIVTLCRKCHHEFDNGIDREYYRERIEKYLLGKYPNWNKESVVFKNKWINGNSYDTTSEKK
ncbi:MAG: HNH endonuclease [Bacteroidia bacterium]|nr:HNH endonuclease [Bacteroidia bacterium]